MDNVYTVTKITEILMLTILRGGGGAGPPGGGRGGPGPTGGGRGGQGPPGAGRGGPGPPGGGGRGGGRPAGPQGGGGGRKGGASLWDDEDDFEVAPTHQIEEEEYKEKDRFKVLNKIILHQYL